jgi:phosphopantothenoylcysteine decarboxylase / phosphopantothenate---cysteine ligase
MKKDYFSKKKVLLGITGGIAAYKSLEFARLLIKKGAEVRVVMTQNAKEFVHPNSFEVITTSKVHTSLFEESSAITHINLAKWADLLIIVPATACIIGKLASGICDDLLTTLCAATLAKIILVPSMNKVMWKNAILQANIKKLQQHNYDFIEPAVGEQACGDYGCGRMKEPTQIISILDNQNKVFENHKVLITAGPTREYIDPIRYISNNSSGKMGYALAQTFYDLGADVSLITGPTSINPPEVSRVTQVITADEMYNKVLDSIKDTDIFVSVAAVSDYKISAPAKAKIKKDKDNLELNLNRTKDILSTVAKMKDKPFCVGFAAETDSLIENARKKLLEKNLDLIIANQIEESGFPFDSESNKVVALDKNNNIINFNLTSKVNIAKQIVTLTKDLLTKVKA